MEPYVFAGKLSRQLYVTHTGCEHICIIENQLQDRATAVVQAVMQKARLKRLTVSPVIFFMEKGEHALLCRDLEQKYLGIFSDQAVLNMPAFSASFSALAAFCWVILSTSLILFFPVYGFSFRCSLHLRPDSVNAVSLFQIPDSLTENIGITAYDKFVEIFETVQVCIQPFPFHPHDDKNFIFHINDICPGHHKNQGQCKRHEHESSNFLSDRAAETKYHFFQNIVFHYPVSFILTFFYDSHGVFPFAKRDFFA